MEYIYIYMKGRRWHGTKQNKRHVLFFFSSNFFCFHSHSFCTVHFLMWRENTMAHPRFCWCDSDWANHFILSRSLSSSLYVLLLLLLLSFHFSFSLHASQSVNSPFLLLRINLIPQNKIYIPFMVWYNYFLWL